MKDNVVVQWAIIVLAVTAGQLLLKVLAGYLPSVGVLGSVRAVILNM